VIVTDPAGAITFVNEAASRIHGVADLQVPPDEYASTYNLFTEEGLPYPSAELPLARAVLRDEVVTDARWIIRRPDGTRVVAVGSARPVHGPDGDKLGAVLTLRDDTARVTAEAALRELNENLETRVAETLAERNLLATIFETTDAFIQVLDFDFRFLAINKACADEFERIYGVRPKVGITYPELLAERPEELAAVQRFWGRALAGEEFTFTEAFGDPVLDRPYYEIKFNTLRNESGERIGAYQFVYDVTERLHDQHRLCRPRSSYDKPRRWRPWASSPVASLTTSTISCKASPAPWTSFRSASLKAGRANSTALSPVR
jgi:PAS domain S-box-containing protein